MDLHLAGKTAVVTGGSKGIGLAVVHTLLAEGMRVVTGSRTITAELKESEAVPMTVDLTTAHGPAELIDRAVGVLGSIDLLVNNVGVGDTDDFAKGVRFNLLELPDDAWEHTFDLHFYSALRASRAALPYLIERKGTIVNVSSAGARAAAGPADYNVSKAALGALTKVIAEQFGGQGVRAVTVSPGPVGTGVWTDPDGFVGRLAKEQGVPQEVFMEQLISASGVTTGRLATPEEVARLIAFLASPVNITGSEHLIDGGMIKHV
ncbi:NAD(P)-dependent dehydrogenase (short-subunit alcohol dehydrogenase family) [Nonomuraea thailandensis]|uniref:NAD(P)-dependent dehydrogenase (Short-subunit alcohol dehydrogenase family) n=1 Tax=Nonomuraea thailandensis TaxID=1188745 RepID=A0A9X2K171_9ACTN|nr:SDR family oxidoreductase [Nonomuraea thailandensis]MCP2353216.1 NAD(P)-dependent dehydrogenase (short-subunit alcohol dehydrogenase family) [Nonomuraea thailandensis]